MRQVLLVIAGILVLSACAVGPDYKSPGINAPKQFVSQDVLKALNEGEDKQVVAADWWTGFNDETLDALVETGLENNFEIAAATARVKEALARIRLVNADDNLNVDIDIESNIQERRELNQEKEVSTTKKHQWGSRCHTPR